MIQTEAIDIATWPADEKFSGAYPEGARPKRTLFSPQENLNNFIKPDWRYMFKRSSGRYPEQFWAEIIAYEISLLLKVPAPPVYAAFDSSNGQCGALSEWFYKEGESDFFSAGNFFHSMIPGFDREKGTQHNLHVASSFNGKVLPGEYIYDFWGMMLFDVIIGNTDRHQDNWGHLLKIIKLAPSVARRKKLKYIVKWEFAPWFDNGTSLGHEILPRKFENWDSGALDRYIYRGKHHIRYSLERLEQVRHVESMRFIANQNEIVRVLLIKKLRGFDMEKLRTILNECVAMKEMPSDGRLSQQRADFIFRLTQRRTQIALEVLHEYY